jgi:hypothetical protein
MLSKAVPSMKPVKSETLAPTIPGSDVKRMRLTYGPYKLRAVGSKARQGNFISLDPQGTGWAYLASDFPTDITVLRAVMNIGYDDGTKIGNANGVYNHHVSLAISILYGVLTISQAFFLDMSRSLTSQIGCQGKSIAIPAINSIMGSAADSGGINLNMTSRPTTGNYIAKGHKILINGDLVNYNNATKEVFMTADVQYVDGKAKGLLETSVHLLPVGTCESRFLGIESLFKRPPKDKKQWSLKGDGLTVKEDGKLVLVRGHLHGRSHSRP